VTIIGAWDGFKLNDTFIDKLRHEIMICRREIGCKETPNKPPTFKQE
jgi:hypothetical protein